jgi:ubiquinone/menaquinone biosynthesis C-methylase UbiE
MDVKAAIQTERDLLRASLLSYTERAFRRLPEIDQPRILDIGCGSGVATVALARISDGNVLALDIEPQLLEQLMVRAAKAGLADRIQTLQCSVSAMGFPEESFDIIWAEGSIYTLGFQKGLTEWRRFLKPDGCLVVHDDVGDVAAKTAAVTGCGYQLLESFRITKADYWARYYSPLERWLRQAPATATGDPELSREIDLLRQELEIFEQIPGRDASVFFILQRKD